MLEIQIKVKDYGTKIHRNVVNVTNSQILFAIKALDEEKEKLMKALRHDFNKVTENEKVTDSLIKKILDEMKLDEMKPEEKGAENNG